MDLWGNYSEEDLYQLAISRPLEEKIESAIALIQTYEGQTLQLSPEGYYGCNSGGKDSQATEELLRMAGVKHTSNYSNVTVDPPELIYHLKKNYPETIWHSQGISLPQYMVKHGKLPPTRMCRWCCEVFKEQGGNGLFKVVGVRAEESKRRKGLWTPLRVDDRTKKPILSPILYWTEDDVWTFLKQRGVPYCSLYDEVDANGKRVFPRLGCVGCPLGSRRKIEFARWPRYEAIWRAAITATWEKWKDIPRVDGEDRKFWKRFSSGEEVWEWWMNEKKANEGEGADCQLWLW